MPYISAKNDRREKLRNGEPALTAGELNYQIFWNIKHNFYDKKLIKTLIGQFLGNNPNYQRYNDMTGVLIRCYKESKRRLHKNPKMLINIMESYDNEIARYENKKILENGDVE